MNFSSKSPLSKFNESKYSTHSISIDLEHSWSSNMRSVLSNILFYGTVYLSFVILPLFSSVRSCNDSCNFWLSVYTRLVSVGIYWQYSRLARKLVLVLLPVWLDFIFNYNLLISLLLCFLESVISIGSDFFGIVYDRSFFTAHIIESYSRVSHE